MAPRDVLITGGSDGIGLAVARLLAAEEGTLVTLVADLPVPNEVVTPASHVESTHYDVLINNAGFGLFCRFTELSLDDQLRMMRRCPARRRTLPGHDARTARHSMHARNRRTPWTMSSEAIAP